MNFDEILDKRIEEERSRTMPKCNWCWSCSECHTALVEHMVDQGAQRIGTGPEIARPSGSGLSHFIDHTLLKPDATRAQIVELCQEAREYNFASVCVNPTWVPEVVELLKGSEVLACTVIGFPLGASTTATKAAETREAVATGAQEIDMVINIGRLKSGEYDAVRDDIAAVVQAAAPARVKVIIETCYLSDEEKIKACILSMEARAHFVKTSTGFGSGGATPDDVALMRRVVGPTMGVKASGGIRGYDTARAMIEAGASRLGASASVAIVTGDGKKSGEGY